VEADQATKLDGFHYLRRIFLAVRQSSPLWRYFKEFITAAVYVDNTDDIARQKAELRDRGLSAEEVERMPAKYFRKRMTCRRFIPKVSTVFFLKM
jgi:hypothetical protein